MKKWAAGLVLVLLACLPILLGRSSSSELLRDTDTAFLLQTIRERQDPLSWFVGDWPLLNHFYRPVSTLAFEMDNALYRDAAWGYGLTNALLCVACVALLFWFLREITDSLAYSVGGAVLFAVWHSKTLPPFGLVCTALCLATLVIGFFRHGLKVRGYLPAAMLLAYLPVELDGMTGLYGRMVAWVPGRTASVMTVFALAAMAAYARYERTGAVRSAAPAPGPLDPPATRGTQLAAAPSRLAWVWLALAAVCTALALGSYEQAVMLPAALLGVAVLMRWQRYQSRWAAQALFWGLLGGYLFLRWKLLPAEVSGYQKQQFRAGPGVWLSIFDYVMPNLTSLRQLGALLGEGWVVLMLLQPYQTLWGFACNAVAYWKSLGEWRLAFAGWAWSVMAFLPMAWLKHFDHYEYWPMALRTVFVLALIRVAGKAVLTAWSPPTLQAPPRPVPAPGSLPHP